MTCTGSSDVSEWSNPVPMSFDEWKSILSQWTTPKPTKLPTSSSESHRQSNSPGKKQDRTTLPRNQVFGDSIVDSFLISQSSNILQSSISLTRQEVPKLGTTPGRRYVSSFKTISNGVPNRPPQRISYINDSVLILKLSKEQSTENAEHSASTCNKYSSLSMSSNVTIKSAKVPSTPAPPFAFPPRLSPILKVEGQKRRIVQHDSSLIAPSPGDPTTAGSSTNQMSTSTSNHPQSNSSLFTYRSTPAAATAAGGNINRPRAMPDPTTTNSLLISTDKLKSNMPSSLRSTRQPVVITTNTTSALMSSQQMQRSTYTNGRSRGQLEKMTPSRENYEYPDPFGNCPQDILSKLAQLTKLQLETIDWEKKKRFTKRKPNTHGQTHGKDSP